MNQVKILVSSVCLAIVISSFFSSCRSDGIIETELIELSFSRDTLRFDTVFTEVGTITRFVKIYNHELDAVIINELTLASGNDGKFRMNVDGYAGQQIEDVRIEGQDSIYVFVEATIDPNEPLSDSPFIIEDQILISANQSDYVVHLEAFGQNANYIPNRFSASTINTLSCNGSIQWNDSKPYVIYGVLAIDQCDLIIAAGTKVYIHGGFAINELGVYNDGLLVITETSSLTVNGTFDNPVYFLTDRLEDEFLEIAGQWGGIIIQANSRNNEINHAIIRNSIVGLSIDSSAILELYNSEIAFTSGNGISGSHAVIKAENCLFHSNGQSGINLGYGGNYSFAHCTVANYDNQASALNANNIKCSDPLCQEDIFVYPFIGDFTNCLFVGNEMDEISLFDLTEGTEAGFFDFQFDHCVVIVDELLDTEAFPNFFDRCKNCLNITRNDSLFIDLMDNDYHLDTLSLAIDMGIYIPGIDSDIEGNPRETESVDLGCYEFQK